MPFIQQRHIDRIETAQMIKKRQLAQKNIHTAYKQLIALAV